MRKIIPACAVTKIRKAYPSETGIYTGYLDGVEVPEMEFPWMQILKMINRKCLGAHKDIIFVGNPSGKTCSKSAK